MGKDFFEKYFELIISVFLIAQPFIDMITALMIVSYDAVITVGMVSRLLFMAFIFYYIVFGSKLQDKKKINIYLGSVFSYVFIFLFMMFNNKGIGFFTGEISWLIKVIYFPLISVGFFVRKSEGKFDVNTNLLINILSIYVISIFTAYVLGIGLDAYAHSKVGSVGLFYSANEVGGIICILLPFLVSRILRLGKMKDILILFVVIFCGLFLGTKTPLLGLIVVCGLFFINHMWKQFKKGNYVIVGMVSSIAVVLFVIAIIILPKTPFVENIIIHANFLEVNSFWQLFDFKVIDRFILSDRITFLNGVRSVYWESSIFEKMFGIGFVFIPELKTIEMDYFEIFYRYGVVGVITILLPLVYFVVDFVKHWNNIALEYKSSIVMILVLAMLTGHVFVAPAVSIYIPIIFLNAVD